MWDAVMQNWYSNVSIDPKTWSSAVLKNIQCSLGSCETKYSTLLHSASSSLNYHYFLCESSKGSCTDLENMQLVYLTGYWVISAFFKLQAQKRTAFCHQERCQSYCLSLICPKQQYSEVSTQCAK